MSPIRLLILGVLRFKQPTHGYEVRRELESWRAEQWANIAYGSIYFALGKMAEEGLVEATQQDQAGKRPARTIYTITQDGEQEFQRLLRTYWWEPKPVIDPFQVALSFMPELPRDELLAALRYRMVMARSVIEAMALSQSQMARWGTPRHIAENFRRVTDHYTAEMRWAEEAIEKVERGELP